MNLICCMLAGNCEKVVGGYDFINTFDFNRDGDIEDFLSLSIDAKTKGILIYLRMIKELNSNGYSFQDHKGDS